MVRKCAVVFGILLGASALVLDGTASTAEACGGCGGGCRTRCFRQRCCAPMSCSTCAPAPCYSSCNRCSTCSTGSYYAAPACSSCSTGSTGYYGYPTPVNAVQVPGYGAQYGYAAPVLSYPRTMVYRARYVTMR